MDEMFASYKCPVCGSDIHTTDEYCNCCHSVCTLVSVGRENCDIVIEDLYVSRHHLDIVYIQYQSKSFFTIFNYGVNGTVVGGRELRNRESITIPNIGTMPPVLLCNRNNLDWEIVKRHIAWKKRINRDELPQRPKCAPSSMPMQTASRTPLIFKIFTAPIAIIVAPISIVASGFSNAVSAIKERTKQTKQNGVSYRPTCNSFDEDSVFSSVFAPAEIKRKSHMQVQVYLHLYEKAEKVKSLAQESERMPNDEIIFHCNAS